MMRTGLLAGAFLLIVAAGASSAESIPVEAFQTPVQPPAESLIQEEQDGETFGPADDAEFVSGDAAAPALAGGVAKPFSLSTAFEDFVLGLFDLGVPGDPSSKDHFRWSVGLSGGYDDNVLYAPTNPIGSLITTLDSSLVYNFGSPRFQVAAALDGGVTYYENRPGDSTDLNVKFLMSATYQWTRRLGLVFSSQVAYLSQPDPLLVGGVSRFSGDYYFTDNSLTIDYRLRPLIGLNVSYQVSGFRYTDEVINQGQGYYQQNFILGIDYLLVPRTTLTVQYRFNPVTYYEADLGSVGQILLFGFEQQLSPRLEWTFQAGAEERRLTNPGVDGPSSYLGPFVETELTYGFGPASEVSGKIRYGTEPSGVSGLAIRQTLRGSLAVRHSFTGRLVADAGVSYENDNYDQPGITSDFQQEIYAAFFGLRFQLNPAFALTGRYDYSMLTSELEIDEYKRGVGSIGFELIF